MTGDADARWQGAGGWCGRIEAAFGGAVSGGNLSEEDVSGGDVFGGTVSGEDVSGGNLSREDVFGRVRRDRG